VTSSLSARNRRVLGWTAPVGIFLIMVFVPFLVPASSMRIIGSALILAILSMSLNLLVGFGGMDSLGHALYFGVGAYAVGLLSYHFGLDLPATLVVAIVGPVLIAAIVGLIIRKTRGAGYMMITLAAAQVFWGLALQWTDVTKGDDGLYGLGAPSIGGLNLGAPVTYFYVVVVLTALVYIVLRLIALSPYGYALQGVRDNEQRMRAMGVDVERVRYVALLISAAIAGLAGLMYAYQERYVSPNVLSITTSGNALLMAAIGGGSVGGAFFGGIIVGIIQDFVGGVTERYLIILGGLFVAVALFLPRGLTGLAESTKGWLSRRLRRPRPDAPAGEHGSESAQTVLSDAAQGNEVRK
jgi:branched-chain amino acid transport system permease protein